MCSELCSRYLRFAATIVVLLGFAGVAIAAADDGEGRSKRPTRESSLQRLRTVEPYTGFVVGTADIVYGWTTFCMDDILFLSKLKDDVDAELEELTSATHDIHVRYRGMLCLVMRGNETGVKIAAEWMKSGKPAERFAAWNALHCCPKTDVVYGIISPESMIAKYRGETTSVVKADMLVFFAERKASFAVDAICETMSQADYRGGAEPWALGRIGDARAVDSLIRSRHCSPLVLRALGQIGDKKGADLIIRNLYGQGGPLALAHIGGRKSLAALLNHRQKLERAEVPQGISKEYLKSHTDEVLMAIMLLTSKDPRNRLMDIAEDATNSLSHRKLALQELQRLGISPVLPRFLAFYRSVMSTTLGAACIPVVEQNASNEATDALKAHQLVVMKLIAAGEDNSSALIGKDLVHAKLLLRSVLHERIGNEFFEIGELKQGK